MKIKNKSTYLSDGTKISIPLELYRQLEKWENQGTFFIDEDLDNLKIIYHITLNSDNRYYNHNSSLETELEKENASENILRDKKGSVEGEVLDHDLDTRTMTLLDSCTATQKRRFIKNYFMGYSFAQIAIQENCSECAVRKSIHAVEQMLINCEQLL